MPLIIGLFFFFQNSGPSGGSSSSCLTFAVPKAVMKMYFDGHSPFRTSTTDEKGFLTSSFLLDLSQR